MLIPEKPTLSGAGGAAASGPVVGQAVDLAPFAWVRWWSGAERHSLAPHDLAREADGCYHPAFDPETGAWHLGLEWPEPQNVRQVVVRFADPGAANTDLRVEYWRKSWPTPAPERRPGAHSGWFEADDPWNGSWTIVRAAKTIAGDTCTFTFDPLDLAELRNVKQLNEAGDYLAPFRRTLKIRLVWPRRADPLVRETHVFADGVWQDARTPGTPDLVGWKRDTAWAQAGGAPLVAEIAAYSEGIWQEATAEVQFHRPGDWSGRAEITHGYLLGMEAIEPGDTVSVVSGSWRLAKPVGSVKLRVLYAHGEPASGDTVVTLWTGSRSFSFLVRDLVRGPIYIKDFGVFLTTGAGQESYEGFLEKLAAAPKPIYDRVAAEPEQSLARAMAEIPPLDVTRQDSLQEGLGRYVVLGVDGGRQEFGLRYNGDIFLSKPFLKPFGRDLARLAWPGAEIFFRVGTGDPPDFRPGADATRQSREDGYLPIFVSEWTDREITWTETAFAALLDGPLTSHEARRGDEDVVAMVRFSVRNDTPGYKRGCLWLAVEPQEEWQLRDGCVVAVGRLVPDVATSLQWRVDPYRAPYLRLTARASTGHLATVPYADGAASRAVPTALLYQVDLAPYEIATLDLAFPFPSFSAAADWARVAALDWEASHADVAAFWHDYVAAGGQLDVPEKLLSDFSKAVRTHVAITADKDPVAGLTIVAPATFSYGSCADETCWQIGMLDEAGYHARAEHYLEVFLQTQGVAALNGNFQSAEGSLQGLDLDGGKPVWGAYVFGYNLDHGYLMECLARHYRLTGDTAWLRRVAPNLVAACDLIIRERQATKVLDPDSRPAPHWGLLPAGHLEDNPEWRYWFCINAHAHAGMKNVAAALADIDHPEAARLARETAAYRDDIRRAARRAMIEAPVVRLLNGASIPRIPTRAGLRGRDWGHFREASYGALHLLDCDVFEPWEEEMTWVLQDLEDNLFVSREWGRPVDLERYWFSHGGVAIQSNLMDLGIAYLRRGQIEHALRALFNNFGSQLYPDVRVFTEHAVTELGIGIGPFYKSSDESKAVQWLRAFLLREEGETLHLAAGAPRAWFAPGQAFGVCDMASYFGPVTYRVEADASKVSVRLQVPDRRPPRDVIVHARRPGCQLLQGVIVNGRPHADFDPVGETVRIEAPAGALDLQLTYQLPEGGQA